MGTVGQLAGSAIQKQTKLLCFTKIYNLYHMVRSRMDGNPYTVWWTVILYVSQINVHNYKVYQVATWLNGCVVDVAKTQRRCKIK